MLARASKNKAGQQRTRQASPEDGHGGFVGFRIPEQGFSVGYG